MGVILGVLAALGFGISDVLGARASRAAASLSVTRTALLASIAFAPFFLLVQSFHLTALDVSYAAGSGLCTGAGLTLLYLGYSKAPIGIVGPVAAVLTAGVPVLVDVVRGNALSWTSAVGVAIGLVALAITTYLPGGRGSIRLAIALGVLAGVGFGLGFLLLGLTTDAAGLAPVVVQRVAAFLGLTAIAPFVRAPLLVTRNPARRTALLCGVFGGAAMAILQLAYRAGSVGPVSVAASQFAAAAVLISAIVNRERLRWWQSAGLLMASVGVGLIALG